MSGAARLRENILALSILQMLNYAVPLITVPYLVRALGPAHYGMLTFAQALVIWFDAITGYGFSLSATRAVACRRGRPVELAETFWNTIYARAALLLLSALMLAVLVAAVPRLRGVPSLYAAAFLTVIGTAVFPVWFFQGLEQMRYITLAQAAARLLSIPALLLLVRQPGDYVRAAVIQGGVPVLAAALIAPFAWRRLSGRPPRPRWNPIRDTLREGWHLFATQIGLVLSTSTSAVVLGFTAGNAAVGYYSAADKVIRAVSSLLGPVAQALYPHLSSLRESSLDLAVQLMRKSFVWIAGCAAAASLGIFILAAPLGPLVWGRDFLPAIAVLRWLAPLPLVFALINILGTQTLVVFGMDELVGRVALTGAAVNVLLAAAFSVPFGAAGAAAASVGSGLLVVVALAWQVRKRRVVWAVCAS